MPGRGVTALFGPSGCGKTSLLRCLAGLVRPHRGALAVNGAVWQSGRRFTPPHRRPVGYVFQEASLFRHLSVRGNLSYGRRRSVGSAPNEAEVIDLLGIGPLLDRPVRRLSGGERQRVAIGRALLSAPRLLLMDEPLSALDRDSREAILPYLERIHARLDIPVVYVTHDMAEVERLADTLVTLADGRVTGAGPLAERLAEPAGPFTRGPRAASILDGTVRGHDRAYDLTEVAVPGGQLLVAGDLGPEGTEQRLRIPADDVSLGRRAPEDTTILNALTARIVTAEEADRHMLTVHLRLGAAGTGAALLARITRRSWDTLGLAPGDRVVARIKAAALVDGPEAG